MSYCDRLNFLNEPLAKPGPFSSSNVWAPPPVHGRDSPPQKMDLEKGTFSQSSGWATGYGVLP